MWYDVKFTLFGNMIGGTPPSPCHVVPHGSVIGCTTESGSFLEPIKNNVSFSLALLFYSRVSSVSVFDFCLYTNYNLVRIIGPVGQILSNTTIWYRPRVFTTSPKGWKRTLTRNRLWDLIFTRLLRALTFASLKNFIPEPNGKTYFLS